MLNWKRFIRRSAMTMAVTLSVSGVLMNGGIVAYASQEGTVTAGTLNVRSGPSTDYSVIGTVNSGTAIDIISTENGWHQINIDGMTGFVSSQYISVTGSGPQELSGTGTVNVSGLNVRSAASTDADLVGLIGMGQTVTLLGSENGWYKVSVMIDGQEITGYCFGEYITPGGAPSGSEPSDGETPSGSEPSGGETPSAPEPSGGETPSGSGPSGGESSQGPEISGGVKGVVSSGPLNIRSGASMSDGIVGSADVGTEVVILADLGEWYQIQAELSGNTVSGYMYKNYVSVTEENAGTGNEPSGDENPPAQDGFIAVSETVWATTGVNIRIGPGTDYDRLTGLARDASVLRIGVQASEDGWSRVQYGSAVGYVKSEFLTTQNPLQEDTSSELKGEAVVAFALQYLGYPYVWGGNDLNTGVDCSGFTQQVYLHFGISLNRSADAQRGNGIQVASIEEARAGDLIFYGSPSYADHVALYMGDGKVIHASSPRVGIIISDVTYKQPIQINRILN